MEKTRLLLVIALSIGLYSLNLLLCMKEIKLSMVIALSIGLYSLNPTSHKTHKQLLPDAICVAKKFIHRQPPSLHHQNHLLVTILPYAWQNTKILFNSPPVLSSDFHCLFLIFHKSAQALFLTSCNPNKILITRTALHQLSVLYHPLIKQCPPRLLFFLSRKLFYLSGFILLTQYLEI